MLQVSCLTGFSKATIDDLCTIHERNYVLGLEKIVQRGRDDIVDSAPTYITSTSFDDALRVRTVSALPPNQPDPYFSCIGSHGQIARQR
jgi:hypothetical protein